MKKLALLVLFVFSAVSVSIMSSSSSEVAREDFSSPAAESSFITNGDIGKLHSDEEFVSAIKNDSTSVNFGRSTGCSSGCSTGCSSGCSSGCSVGCSIGCGRRW